MSDTVKKSIFDSYMRDWEESDKIKSENAKNNRFPAKHYELGTVENRRQQNRIKRPKRERPDSLCRPFAGYVHDQENFSSRKWSEEALLKKDGYTESVWLENFPD